MKYLTVLSLAVLACAGGIAQRSEYRQYAVLTVKNDWQESIHVYTAHDGQPARQVGIVDMRSAGHFLLQESDFASGQLQVYVLDRLSGVRVFSDVVPVSSVQSFELDFGPLPTQAFLFPKR